MPGPLARTAALLRRVLTRPGAPIAAVALVLVAGTLVPPSARSAAGEAVVDREAVLTAPARVVPDRAARTDVVLAVLPEPTPEASVAPAEVVPAATPAPTPGPVEEVPAEHRIALAAPAPGMEAFAGLSTWIDLYDVEWTPEQQAEVAHRGGVDTIFVQTARFNSPDDIHDPARLGALIEAAHDRGMTVMTWYIPDFVDPAVDLRRSQAAIAFTTPRGDRPDAFGLDIELDAVPDVELRNARLLDLSARLRAWTGPDYPLAAIVLPPLQLDLNGTWWPGFPYAALRPFYDVYIPMSYSSYRGTGPDITTSWNLRNVLETRRRAGDPNLPIHLAGGIADNLPEVDAFVEAARQGIVLGAGLYDLHTTRADAWAGLQALRLTPGTAGEVPSRIAP